MGVARHSRSVQARTSEVDAPSIARRGPIRPRLVCPVAGFCPSRGAPSAATRQLHLLTCARPCRPLGPFRSLGVQVLLAGALKKQEGNWEEVEELLRGAAALDPAVKAAYLDPMLAGPPSKAPP